MALTREARVHAWSTGAYPAELEFRNRLDDRFFEVFGIFVVGISGRGSDRIEHARVTK